MKGAACLICVWAATAAAQPSTELFAQGVALKAQGKLEEACAAFERSYQLEQAPGTALNVADCAERAGNLARALELYTAAERAFTAAGSEPRARFARNRAEAVRSRLPEKPAPAAPSPRPQRHARGEPSDARPARHRAIAGGVAIGGFGVTALAIAAIAYEINGPIDIYRSGVPAFDSEGVALDSSRCDNVAVATSGNIDAWRDACRARTRSFIEGSVGLAGLAVGVGALVYRFTMRDDRALAARGAAIRPIAIGSIALGGLGLAIAGLEYRAAKDRVDAAELAASEREYHDLSAAAADQRRRATLEAGIGLATVAGGIGALIYVHRTRDDRPVAIVPARDGAAVTWSW